MANLRLSRIMKKDNYSIKANAHLGKYELSKERNKRAVIFLKPKGNSIIRFPLIVTITNERGGSIRVAGDVKSNANLTSTNSIEIFQNQSTSIIVSDVLVIELGNSSYSSGNYVLSWCCPVPGRTITAIEKAPPKKEPIPRIRTRNR